MWLSLLYRNVHSKHLHLVSPPQSNSTVLYPSSILLPWVFIFCAFIQHLIPSFCPSVKSPCVTVLSHSLFPFVHPVLPLFVHPSTSFCINNVPILYTLSPLTPSIIPPQPILHNAHKDLTHFNLEFVNTHDEKYTIKNKWFKKLVFIFIL